MGLGRITRVAGKAGAAIEALGYLWMAGSAMVRLVSGRGAKNQAEEADHLGKDDEATDASLDQT